jgi:hypothetical protein
MSEDRTYGAEPCQLDESDEFNGTDCARGEEGKWPPLTQQ